MITVKSLTDGGAERVASLWANGFVERGHDVIIVNNTNKLGSYNIDNRIILHNLHSKSRSFVLSHIQYIINLRKLIREYRPNVIINVLNPGAVYDFIASLGLGIPIINTEHNAFERPDNAPLTKIESFCKMHFNSILNKVTVLTHADKRIVDNRLNNVVVLPNPCTFAPQLMVPEKEKTIFAVGRLDEWKVKGFDILIDAWSKISPIYPEWKLNIMGSSFTDGKKYLSSLVDIANLSNSVSFIDYNSDIISEYQRASIFVLSSRYEGFGMVLLEAMSQGCACIACDYKGRQREILGESQYGLVCDTDDSTMLANHISSLISNDNLRQELQVKAIHRSKDYSIKIIMDKWDAILTSII